jgi:C-terminal peptidase prc
VDGKDMRKADSHTLASALAGPEGSVAQLTIERGNDTQTVQITRGQFYFPPLESRVLAGGVGYLRLGEFVIAGSKLPNDTEILADLDRSLDELDEQGAQSLILDLRGNAGGSVQTADELLGRFLPDTAPTLLEADERGHQAIDLAAGRLHARQLPMAVLIDGDSASASEITAAALRTAHRAVLVGQKTAGAVASSVLLPLPGGAGLQVAVATAAAPDGAPLDGVGVAPDVAASETAAGGARDTQLDSAISALASAPAPPAVAAATPALSSADLDQALSPALPDGADIPTNDRLVATDQWQRLTYTHPNEVIDQNGGAPDPVALQQALRSRGYQGSVMASYGSVPGDLPTVSVNVDLYATDDGAHASVSTNDSPELQESITPVVQLGDETVAYRGTWLAAGSTFLAWRRGRVVCTVTYSDVPGLDRPDTLTAIGELVDARAQQLNLP